METSTNRWFNIYKVRKNTINGRCATRIVLFVAMIILSWGLILVCQFLLSAGEVVQKMSGRVSGYLQLMPGIFGLHQISLHHMKFILSEIMHHVFEQLTCKRVPSGSCTLNHEAASDCNVVHSTSSNCLQPAQVGRDSSVWVCGRIIRVCI